MAIKPAPSPPSQPNRHHLVPPSAAWRPLTIASPRTISGRQQRIYIVPLSHIIELCLHDASRLGPTISLILISRTFLSCGVPLVLYIAPLFSSIMSTNATCFTPKATQKGPSLFQHGTVTFQGMCNMLSSVYPRVLDARLIVCLYGTL